MPKTTTKPTTDEQPITVRLSAKAWIAFLVAQFSFCSMVIGAGSVWANTMEHDILTNRQENDRQNQALEKLASALKEVADSGEQTARTLERVMGRLEVEGKK